MADGRSQTSKLFPVGKPDVYSQFVLANFDEFQAHVLEGLDEGPPASLHSHYSALHRERDCRRGKIELTTDTCTCIQSELI